MPTKSTINYRIFPSIARGSILVPPSKSHTLRAILLASLLSGHSTITNPLISPDVRRMIVACRQLGAKITESEQSIEIRGVGGQPASGTHVIDAGNSGQILRFMGAMASLIQAETIITGDTSVKSNRPVKALMDALRQMGAECISLSGNDHAPIKIRGPVKAGRVCMDGQDSQPVSAILMLAAFLEGKTEIQVRDPGEKPWLDLTLFWLAYLGVKVEREGYEKFMVSGGVNVSSIQFTVPGDFSSMAYPLAAGLLTGGGVRIQGLIREDVQGDSRLIEILKTMGAALDWEGDELCVYSGGELIAQTIDVNDCIDALPILAVIGCFAKGITKLVNAGIARKKECDRLAVMTKQLKKMGANITEYPDALHIGNSPLMGARVYSHQDHRVALSLAVAGLGAQGDTLVQDVGCVQKSYPFFSDSFKALGCGIEVFDEYDSVRL